MTPARSLARLLTALAGRLTPRDRTGWARASARELDEIADDRTALSWAIGCLWTTVVAEGILPRLALAGLTAGFASSYAYWTALIFGYRQGWIGPDAWSDPAKHEHFARIVEATPNTTLALWAGVQALFFTAALLLVFRRRSAPTVFVVAATAWLLQTVLFHMTPAYRPLFTPMIVPADLLTVPVLMFMAVGVSRLSRPRFA